MGISLSNPLGLSWTPGRFGEPSGEAGISAHHHAGLTVVEVAALPGKGADMRAALQTAFNIDMGDGSPAASSETAVCCGPDRYLLVGHTVKTVKTAIGELGMATDQSSGRVKVSLDGPKVAEMFAKSCPLDLRSWPEGMSQASHFSHIGCCYYRRSDTGFDVFVGRSFAESFGEFLKDASAEFGLEVL